MKKATLLFAVIGIMALGSTSFAQDTPPPKENGPKLSATERAEKKTEKMTKELGLTDEQAAKVKAINLEHFKEMEKLKAAMKENRESHNADINAVLTPAQKAILDQKQAERRVKHKEHKRPSPPEKN